MSDHDIITLLTTDAGPDTAAQGSVLLSQTPTLVTEEQQESQDDDIEEISQEPPKKKTKTDDSSKVSGQYKRHICDDCGKELT